MTAEDWSGIQAHFDALCDLPEAEQRSRLAALELSPEARRRLELLLAFDQPEELDSIARSVGRLARDVDRAGAVGQQIGPYRIRRALGEGGMGDVYLAERNDGRFEARVAIKFLAIRGLRGRKLFDRERQILARLDHPAIARILDAGEHPELGAYLVMEYVDGAAIHTAAKQHTIDPTGLIDLLCQAADAVAHAHQNLVLHRDLKPDHLLITPGGQIKVLDFGVAALLAEDSETAEQTGHSAYTPRYAAPEQLLHQATTTRTDVYALGLVLYELLSGGSSPFGEDRDRLSENKLAGQCAALPPLAGLQRRQRLDMDAILQRCLARLPQDRYAGPGELAADLRAVLDDQPISVRRPGSFELIGRWLNRHRLAGAAISVAVLAITGGSTAAMLFAQNARIERNVAIQEAEKAQAITAFLEGIFTTATPGRDQGPDTPVRELLARGSERLADDLAGQPEATAYLELAIARSYMFLGLYDEAFALLADADAGAPDTRRNRTLVAARIDNLRGRYRDALARLERIQDDDLSRNQRAELELRRANALVNLEQIEPARRAALQAIELGDDSEAGLDLRTSGQNMLGVLAYNRGEFEQARQLFSDMLELRIRQFGEVHGTTAMNLFNLGSVSLAMSDPDTALGYFERALAAFEALFGVENRTVAMSHRALGITRQRMSDAASAERSLNDALRIYETWGGRDNPTWREAALKLVELHLMLDRRDAAESLLLELPEGRADEPPQEQLISCRIQRLRQLLDLAPPAEGEDCSEGRTLPDFSLALEHYLRARWHGRNDPTAFGQAHAAGLEVLERLRPAEPLLAAAYRRLSPPPGAN
jgi:serine/threonine-protein kinase